MCACVLKVLRESHYFPEPSKLFKNLHFKIISATQLNKNKLLQTGFLMHIEEFKGKSFERASEIIVMHVLGKE